MKEDTDAKFVGVETKGGYRIYKENDLNASQCKVRVLVGNRFVVEIVGLNMKFEAVEGLTNSIPFAMLDKMAAGK